MSKSIVVSVVTVVLLLAIVMVCFNLPFKHNVVEVLSFTVGEASDVCINLFSRVSRILEFTLDISIMPLDEEIFVWRYWYEDGTYVDCIARSSIMNYMFTGPRFVHSNNNEIVEMKITMASFGFEFCDESGKVLYSHSGVIRSEFKCCFYREYLSRINMNSNYPDWDESEEFLWNLVWW